MNELLNAVKRGLLTKNPLFVTGILLSPAIFCSTLKQALAAAMVFTIVTVGTAVIVNVLPLWKLVYTVRIILYTVIAALVYIPALKLSLFVFPSETAVILIYLQCLVANSLILERFDKRPFTRIRYKLIFTVSAAIGYDLSLLLFAGVREIISYGTFYGNPVGISTPLPAFGAVFGGFILLAFFAALYRQITKFADNLKAGLKND
ncbi:MAG: hypothetical protein LBM87_05695 [Ruminococcus sp.]|jgi:electron transport complex protein RnfE|nr:hypothetical protein [Ruminococcus sp.]